MYLVKLWIKIKGDRNKMNLPPQMFIVNLYSKYFKDIFKYGTVYNKVEDGDFRSFTCSSFTEVGEDDVDPEPLKDL